MKSSSNKKMIKRKFFFFFTFVLFLMCLPIYARWIYLEIIEQKDIAMMCIHIFFIFVFEYIHVRFIECLYTSLYNNKCHIYKE